MELVFISGWATSNNIWSKIGDFEIPVHYIDWNTVLKDDFRLPESCILTGWSLGGQLAMELSTRPEVKGIVLISSMSCIASGEHRPGIDPSKHQEIASMLNKSTEGYLRSFFRECGAGRNELPSLVKDSAAFSTEDLLYGLDVMFSKVTVPAPDILATVIHGTADRIIPFSLSEYIAEKLFEGKTSLLPVTEGGHLIPLTHPQVVTQEVKKLAQRINS
ncbi:MAG: alpha/beta hydrolase [Candidatus Fermentibacteraceae bacterium]|nr:alpha/beta hydrolase [Candidatus Fermentibacteraceae bacterium]